MRNSVWSAGLTLLLTVRGSSPAYISQLAPLSPPHFLPEKHLVYRSPLVRGDNGGSKVEKHNCTLQEVEERGHICTPDIVTSCHHLVAGAARVTSQYNCYNVSSTVCTVRERLVEQSVCRYHYQYRLEETAVEAVEVTFEKECRAQSVTVCDPHHLQHCREISQETCHLQPRLERSRQVVEVRYPEPVLSCGRLTIRLPSIECQVLAREAVCLSQPVLRQTEENLARCVSQAEPAGASCRTARLSLPSQTCSERDFGLEL